MPETVNAYQVGAFSTPVNGAGLDANVVRSNDLALRAVHNGHDADPGVHLQSGLLASRPGFGVQGRKWLTSDTLRLYYDTGIAWAEAAYLPLAGGTLTGDLELSAASGERFLYLSRPSGQTGAFLYRSGTSSRWGLSISNAAESGGNAGSNLRFDRYNDSGVYVDTVLEIVRSTGAATFFQGLGGTLSTAAQPNVTSLGTLTALGVSGNVNLSGNTATVTRRATLDGTAFSDESLASIGEVNALTDVTTSASRHKISYAVSADCFAVATSEGVRQIPCVDFTVASVTAPGAGGAAALPATPLGYTDVFIGGVRRKIAFYAA